MKKESIDAILTPIMEKIDASKIDSRDKTELMIMIGRFLESYNFEEYSEMLYGKKLVKKYENI